MSIWRTVRRSRSPIDSATCCRPSVTTRATRTCFATTANWTWRALRLPPPSPTPASSLYAELRWWTIALNVKIVTLCCSLELSGGGERGEDSRPERHFPGGHSEWRKFGIWAFALQCVSVSLYLFFKIYSVPRGWVLPVGGAVPRTFAPGGKNPRAATDRTELCRDKMHTVWPCVTYVQ